MMLGGHILSQEGWKNELREFWRRYEPLDPSHPAFHSGLDLGLLVPHMVHGDEGRGRQKQALLTISFQGMISHYGSHRLNISGSLGY